LRRDFGTAGLLIVVVEVALDLAQASLAQLDDRATRTGCRDALAAWRMVSIGRQRTVSEASA
jgi:hypothetical protein